MESFTSFLKKIETNFALSYKSTKGCFNISNSGRRGESKEFSLSYESIVSALKDIKNNIEQFSAAYDETTWRTAANVFSDNTIKSFCGVQTKPFFETINKLLSWANNFENTDGQMTLTSDSISNLLDKFETIDCLDSEALDSDKLYLFSYTPNFSQIIYYGVPGSGKSHKIDEETKDLPDEQKMRVVFHPEYTNADFVGQILPSNADGTISYKFKPGPFTKILRRAYLNPSKKHCLIIEEINRGNAAAIFGDVFQLLDRITDGKPETTGGYSYGNGWSRYSIENDFMNWYIRENLYANHKLQNEDDGIAEKSDELQKSIEIGNLHFSALTGIRLPPNLSLYATMNTSDQNVFTLDNAFQRRWDMKLVENKFEGEDAEKQRNAKIGGTEITWENFQTFINKKISESSSSVGMSSMEDKRLGCWFVKETDGKISKEKFAEKVLKYLWDDAFKFNHDDIFNIQENASFESIVEKFKGKENESCDWSIFKDRNFIQSANEQ